MSNKLITNAQIYDGGLSEPFMGSVYIKGDRIAEVSRVPAPEHGEAVETVDAAGRLVCPGFVDIHRHPDVKPLIGWRSDTELRQGITTVVAGNCGISMTPAAPNPAEQYAFDEPVLGPMCPNPPRTYPEYMDALTKCELPLNFAAMIGTGSVRISIKGFESAPFTESEMERAQRVIDEALQYGAPGISMGIMYLPECYGSTDEFARMLRPVGRRSSIITTHIRGEGDSMVKSVAEVIDIARHVGCGLEISHFKSCGVRNWRRQIHEAIELIERARAEGLDVACDFYPYDGGSTALTTMLPPAFVAGDMNAALKRLGTPAGVDEFRRSVAVEYPDWDNFAITLGWERIIISGVVCPEFRPLLGMNMVDAAAKVGCADAVELAARLMHGDAGRTAIINMSMCQDDIDAIARLPYSSIISDAIYADTDTPHPRMFGAMPRAIREYAVERRLLTLQQVIHKLTALPASRLGLKGRGRLEPDAYADVIMFDPHRLRDNATYSDPARLATGLDLMLINGAEALRDDVVLQRDAGSLVRRRYDDV